MADLTLKVAVKGDTTVMSLRGTVDAARCQLLRDGFRMAQRLRQRGPIVVNFAGVDRLAAVVLLILREVADDARRAGRPVTMRHLHPGTVDDPRSLLLRHTVCTEDDTANLRQRSGTAPA
jgi:anti-anti-sigma regulatory factor